MNVKNHFDREKILHSLDASKGSPCKIFPSKEDLERLLTRLVKPLLHAAGLVYGALLEINETGDGFSFCGERLSMGESADLSDISFEDKTGPVARAVVGRSPVFLPDAEPLRSCYGNAFSFVSAAGPVALIPVMSEDRAYAVLIASRDMPGEISVHEQTVLRATAEILSLYIANHLLKDELLTAKKHMKEMLERHPDTQKLTSIGNVVTEAVRDLNKPLSCISAYIETLRNNISPASDIYDTLERIRRESERARKITSSLSVLSAWCGNSKDSSELPYHPSTGKPIKILVVDDEPAIQESMREVLKRKKFIVDTAGTAEDAFLMLKKEVYDIVICDVRLSDISTAELLKKIRETKGLLDRTILMSGDTANETIYDFIQKNPVHYLTKPFHPADLFEKIKEVVAGEPGAKSNPAVA